MQPKQPVATPAVHPRQHALTIAAATHLRNAGHLPAPQAARIHAKAKAKLNAAKKKTAPAMPPAFGSLAPDMDQDGA